MEWQCEVQKSQALAGTGALKEIKYWSEEQQFQTHDGIEKSGVGSKKT